jgi:hypothetical protein
MHLLLLKLAPKCTCHVGSLLVGAGGVIVEHVVPNNGTTGRPASFALQ